MVKLSRICPVCAIVQIFLREGGWLALVSSPIKIDMRRRCTMIKLWTIPHCVMTITMIFAKMHQKWQYAKQQHQGHFYYVCKYEIIILLKISNNLMIFWQWCDLNYFCSNLKIWCKPRSSLSSLIKLWVVENKKFDRNHIILNIIRWEYYHWNKMKISTKQTKNISPYGILNIACHRQKLSQIVCHRHQTKFAMQCSPKLKEKDVPPSFTNHMEITQNPAVLTFDFCYCQNPCQISQQPQCIPLVVALFSSSYETFAFVLCCSQFQFIFCIFFFPSCEIISSSSNL